MFLRVPSSLISAKRRGFALIVVLTAVVLIAVLVVAFLSSATTELRSSKVYSNGAALKLLSQTASNVVIGQIRLATADASLNWSSQPGMLRTYNTRGMPEAYYKLYSDSGMYAAGAFDHTQSSNGVPSDWYKQKGIYVDLNQPVAVDGTNFFPILDGSAATVAGFWMNGSGTPLDKTSASANPAPMPVKWLYILQNGQIIAPDAGSTSGTVTFNGAPTQASAANQIVGRIAFWTDDETCKVNINTASEGAFWDTPRTYTVQDYYLATRQPVQGEFQRYPGHPASVSLSTVLGGAAATGTWAPDAPLSHEEFYPVTPATGTGGSMGGTVSTSPTSKTMASRVSRLYSTADELLFQANLGSDARQLNAALSGISPNWDLSPDALRKKSFFLTASSHAPDVNVFNLPRISMWPITLDSASGNPAMTPYDKLIAFCTTLNTHPFYFQRQDPTSPTSDLDNAAGGRNRELLEYLRTLTAKPIPGFGSGSLASKYGDDCGQILVEMFDYIRCTNLQDSTTGATPYTRSFDTTASSATYQAGKGQVVPTVDTRKTVTDSTGGTASPRGFGRFPTVQQAALVFIGAGDKNSFLETGVPGFSTYRFAKITSDSVQRVQAGFFLQMFDPSQGLAVTYPWYEIQVDGLDSLQWSNDATSSYKMLFPSTGVVSKPYTRLGGIVYGGISDFRILTASRGKPGATAPYPQYPFITPPTGAVASGTAVNCPDMNGGRVYFKGGSATVKVYGLDSGGSRTALLQTVNLTIPPATIPVPTTVEDPASAMSISGAAGYNFQSFYDSSTTKGRLNFDSRIAWIGSHDVVRSLIATPGDMRLVAARSSVPASFYQPLDATAYPASDYYSGTVPMSHMLRYGLNYPIYGGAGGKLVNVFYQNYSDKYNANDTNYYGGPGNSTYSSTKDVNVPTPTAVSTASGVPADWDIGLANSHDGSFINKADEGDAGNPGGVNGTPYYELDYGNALPGDTFFSPNRMIPSPGMFGSLPTGVWSNKPWQTLLFRPGPAGHAGLGATASAASPARPPYSTPPDHLFMDLFNMPVVEPYAISTPLATAGRINMNYLIVPFTYINRDTGLRAAMKAQMITVIPSPVSSWKGPYYKTRQNPNGSPGVGNAPATAAVRYPIDLDATLSQFRARFDAGDIFRAASEICTIDLVPSGVTGVPSSITRSTMDAFWKQYPLSGDNVRERPYTNLYPLLTTKSNTYTVHMRVQSLKQTQRGDSASFSTWQENKDVVTGEYRGAQTVERYVDPKDALPDYATQSSTAEPLSKYYKFRTVLNRQFSP